MTHRRARLALTAVAAVAFAACGSDAGSDASPSTTTQAPATTTTAETTTEAVASSDAGAPTTEGVAGIDADRCAENESAGTITYLSGFDFAASASIVDVLVAKDRGYYDELCLDVELRASFSTANYPLVAANEAQFASGGSFSEVVDFGIKNQADLVAVVVEGKTGIDTLIVKDGEAPTIEDLAGTTIGVKGKITPSVKAMLAKHGLVEDTDYQTILLDGFDPTAHIAIPTIVGFRATSRTSPVSSIGPEFPSTPSTPPTTRFRAASG
ncbi:MAG: ABC transporter substrate-binding protein [Ilumatobacteraceae bacterium]